MTTLPFSRRQEHERDCWHVQDLAGQLVARWPDPNGSIQIHHARTSDIRLVPLPEACAHSRKAFCFDFPAVEWVRFVNLPLHVTPARTPAGMAAKDQLACHAPSALALG
jgi:hypothetical protein